MRIRWRESGSRFDADAWTKRCLRKLSVTGGPAPSPVKNGGFDATVWLPHVTMKDGGKTAVWYGHSRAAELAIELIINRAVDEDLIEVMTKSMLPTLAARRLGESRRWAVYDVSFVSPPGYTLQERRMHSGDIALKFGAPGGRGLILRQVYPAKLALERREMKGWLQCFPFKERRRYRCAGELAEWTTHSVGKVHRLPGRKQFGWPFGWIAPHVCMAACRRDDERGRLMFAEHEARRKVSEKVIETALAEMDWAYRN